MLISLRQIMIVLVAMLAGYLIYVGYASSFRVDSLSLHPSLNINTSRWLLSILGGIAFGVSSAATLNEKTLINHVRYYSVLIMSVLVYLLVKWWFGLTVLALITSIVSVLLWNSFCERILKPGLSQNVVMTMLLIISFFLSVVVFGFTSIIEGPSLSYWNWLFGGLNQTSNLNVVQMVAITLLVCALSVTICMVDKPLTAALVLLGVAFGLLGAVFFVGAVAAKISILLVGEFKREKVHYYLASGLIAAALVVATDSLPRLIVGGYSPFLLITTTLLMMPLVVLFQLLQANVLGKNQKMVIAEWLLLSLIVSTSIFVIWHLSQFASAVI
jgi:hypothetical protein